MEEEGIKREESESKLGLDDAMEILSALSLTSATVGGNYLVVMRSEFDLTISGEPYVGLVLLLNHKDGTYISRIWNQTVASGNVERPDQLREEDSPRPLHLGFNILPSKEVTYFVYVHDFLGRL